MLIICPFLLLSMSTMAPTCSVGTSTYTSSYGSCVSPSTCLVMTLGEPTWNSNPSLLIVSIKIARCRPPRPLTRNVSDESVSSTRNDTFFSSSLNNRSRTILLVTKVPSRPAKGLVLTMNSMRTVGSSTVRGGRGCTSSFSHTVSPMAMSSKPVRATMSPASAEAMGTRPRFSKANRSDILPFFGVAIVSGVQTTTSFPFEMVPDSTRPMAIRPLCSS
mmetsp:Transcript_38157/g.61769  ORF Transcript_38157/g.61769 Transcript_38157/m.61769 type:complete len:218 (-) Transcript_38157:1078-1731(-)